MIGDYGIGLPSWQVLRWVLIAVAGWAAILLAAYITENYDVSPSRDGNYCHQHYQQQKFK